MIYISSIEPQEDGSTYLKYTINFEGKDHVVNGSFTATKDESNQAFQDSVAWQGFKKLIIDKILNDINTLKGGSN